MTSKYRTTTERMIRNRLYIREVKLSRGCDLCGYNKCSFALDFHHKSNINKIDTINNLCKKLKNIDIINKEITKCSLLCSNCHREQHHDKIIDGKIL